MTYQDHQIIFYLRSIPDPAEDLLVNASYFSSGIHNSSVSLCIAKQCSSRSELFAYRHTPAIRTANFRMHTLQVQYDKELYAL